jgi:hypothetical protein
VVAQHLLQGGLWVCVCVWGGGGGVTQGAKQGEVSAHVCAVLWT